MSAGIQERESLIADAPIAALYVTKSGVYFDLPGVDPWDEERDARLYDGPYPVVAHPPCNRWAKLGPRHLRGQDEGCFAAALAAVRRFGGVLEHPAESYAWRAFGLARPTGPSWTFTLTDPGWVCSIDQNIYGFPTRKPTWLYYVGPLPLEMPSERGTATRGCDSLCEHEAVTDTGAVPRSPARAGADELRHKVGGGVTDLRPGITQAACCPTCVRDWPDGRVGLFCPTCGLVVLGGSLDSWRRRGN